MTFVTDLKEHCYICKRAKDYGEGQLKELAYAQHTTGLSVII